MINRRKVFLLMLAALCVVAVVQVGAQQQEKPLYPVGSIKFESTSIAAGVGVSWGNGTFSFEGKQYPISIQGLGLAAVGIAKVNAVGDVFNLKNASDVAGTYMGISGGIAIAGGPKGILARNQKGVVLDLRATQEGVSLNLGADGFTISMQ
ncbi:MAG: hypothetical protein ACOZFS_06495 [Thermodesulfobacteriota bacterium]